MKLPKGSLLLALKTIFLASSFGLSLTAQAAITSDIDCRDSDGASVYWESQVGIFDKDGNVTGELLYRNQVRISLHGIDVVLSPDRVLTNAQGALLAAWTNDGQYVIVNATHKTKDDGDASEYSGTMEFRVKSKAGVLKRKEGTEVNCSMAGEA